MTAGEGFLPTDKHGWTRMGFYSLRFFAVVDDGLVELFAWDQRRAALGSWVLIRN